MASEHYDAMFAMLEQARAGVAALEVPHPLPSVAGGLTGCLLEMWPILTQDQRLTITGAIAVIERAGGGNAADELAREVHEARAMRAAENVLRRVSGGDPSGK